MNNLLWFLLAALLCCVIGAVAALMKPKPKPKKKPSPKPTPAPAPEPEVQPLMVMEPFMPAMMPLATTSAMVPSYSMVAAPQTTAYAAPAYGYAQAAAPTYGYAQAAAPTYGYPGAYAP